MHNADQLTISPIFPVILYFWPRFSPVILHHFHRSSFNDFRKMLIEIFFFEKETMQTIWPTAAEWILGFFFNQLPKMMLQPIR